MPWDLNFYESRDLEFAPSMDLSIVGGDDLLEQRILVRLLMMRGWIYDPSGELGSNLFTALAQTVETGADSIPALVLEALSPISDEIVVTDVIVRQPITNSHAFEVIVEYHKTSDLASPSVQRVVFPLA